MKNKMGQTIPAAVLEDNNPIKLLKDINDLTVEDVVVIYAYAEAIVETVREPIVILNEKLRIKTANKAFFDMFKVEKKETYDKSIFKLGNGQWDIPSLKRLLLKVLPENSVFNDFEVTHNFEDIGKRTMLLNARRIILEGHKTELILLAIEDATDKKEVEKKKDDFIEIASHELKTPLTSIKLIIDILQAQYQKTKEKKSIYLLGRLDKQVDRVNQLMGLFHNAYSAQTGKLSLQKEDFFIEDIIEEIVETFKYASAERTINSDNETKTKIYADKERVGQVITNLLTNAIKYSPHDKPINVKSKKTGVNIVISVQDFGIGIAKDQQKKIFERFYRTNKKPSKQNRGLGLGLYIADEIVKAHEGKFWIESKIRNGSTFFFSLPIHLEHVTKASD